MNALIESHEFAKHHQVWRLEGKDLVKVVSGLNIYLVVQASVIF